MDKTNKIHSTAVIYSNVEMGKNCSVGEYAIIGRSDGNEPVVIGDDVLIDANVIIRNGVKIGEKTKIGAKCIIGKNATIGKSVVLKDGCIVFDGATIADELVIDEGRIIRDVIKKDASKDSIHKKQRIYGMSAFPKQPTTPTNKCRLVIMRGK